MATAKKNQLWKILHVKIYKNRKQILKIAIIIDNVTVLPYFSWR